MGREHLDSALLSILGEVGERDEVGIDEGGDGVGAGQEINNYMPVYVKFAQLIGVAAFMVYEFSVFRSDLAKPGPRLGLTSSAMSA